MIITKRHLISNTNGTDELFQVPHDYIDGSLWVFEVKGNGEWLKQPTQTFDGGFFQISPAPTAGSDLFCFYDFDVPDESTGLSVFDSKKLDELLKTVQLISEAQASMDIALQKRVTQEDWDKWATLIESRLDL